MMEWAYRNRTELLLRAAALTAVMSLAAMAASCQDFARTVNQRVEGERSLQLTGMLTGADTAYLQVYHDGDELYSASVFRTWSLPLGEQDYYVIKFTDGRRRVKYLYIMELSDDLVEFYPPIEIDFDRTGNLVLLKQSTGKPDWQEFDVGMSRKRRR